VATCSPREFELAMALVFTDRMQTTYTRLAKIYKTVEEKFPSTVFQHATFARVFKSTE
jgi:hypothetical protein